MSFSILRASFLLLMRDGGALLMTLVVPVVFFLIFAEIFATAAGDQLQLRIAIVDEVHSNESVRLLSALTAETAIEVVADETKDGLDREAARELVRRGTADVGVVVRADGEDLATAAGLAAPPLLLLVDPSRSVTATVLAGQLQRAYFSALPDLAVGRVAELIGTQFTEFTPAQQAEIDAALHEMRDSADEARVDGTESDGALPAAAGSTGWAFDDLVERENVAGQNAALNNVAYYAGAVAFMFLLFAAAQSALGILDDQEAGILDRIAAGPAGIHPVVNGRFLFLTLQGFVQASIIFGIAWLLYGVDVPGNFWPWLMITASSAVLSAGVALALVTGCRTRAQAQLLPTVVILIMSAIGGSMVPRFFMPYWLQQLGWITPNTWALEAYSGVFWRSEPALALMPICAGLAATGLVGLALSHWFGQQLVRE